MARIDVVEEDELTLADLSDVPMLELLDPIDELFPLPDPVEDVSKRKMHNKSIDDPC